MKESKPRTDKKHYKDIGREVLTVSEVKKEAARLRRLYENRTRRKPGPRPAPAVFLLEAIRRLSAMKKAPSTGHLERENLKHKMPELCDYDLVNLFRLRAHKEIRWAANWEDLRRGQKVKDLLKANGGALELREIQRKLSLSRDVLDKLPLGLAFTWTISQGRKRILSLNPPPGVSADTFQNMLDRLRKEIAES